MEKCQKIVHPLLKGAADYQCRKQHYADGWCRLHHPKLIAARKEEADLRQREWAAERRAKLEKAEAPTLTIENAIVLLVQSGYRVELVTPNPQQHQRHPVQHQLGDHLQSTPDLAHNPVPRPGRPAEAVTTRTMANGLHLDTL